MVDSSITPRRFFFTDTENSLSTSGKLASVFTGIQFLTTVDYRSGSPVLRVLGVLNTTLPLYLIYNLKSALTSDIRGNYTGVYGVVDEQNDHCGSLALLSRSTATF
jgi:hypothetical protein